MQEIIRHWRRSMSEPITLVIVTLAAVLCMISGPFGTLQAFSPPLRLAYWAPVIVIGGCVSLFIRIVLRLYYPRVAKGLIETATVAIFTVTFGVLLLIWSAVFTSWTGREGFLPTNGMQLLYLAIVAGSFLWLRRFVIDLVQRKASPEEADVVSNPVPEMKPQPRLLRRLPEDQIGEVLYITPDDHFVDIHTEHGTSRLRMRFKDAIDEMEGTEGYCSHRSFWVSKDAISSAERVNSSWRLQLVNGETIPVSRKYQPCLEEAGLLRPDTAE